VEGKEEERKRDSKGPRREYVLNPPAFAWAASLLLGTPAGGKELEHKRGKGRLRHKERVRQEKPLPAAQDQSPGAASFGLPYVQAHAAEGTTRGPPSNIGKEEKEEEEYGGC